MLMHRKHFQKKAKKYLASKGLMIESWSDSVKDGCKADVLALFGLNLLLEMHTIVHLSQGKTWTTLEKQGKTHQEDIAHCDMHLAHVGRGLYVELAPRSIPLQIVDDTTTSQSVVIGEIKTLMDEEAKALDQVQRLGLGAGIAKKPTLSASAGSATDLPRVEKWLAKSTAPKATPAIIPSKSQKSDSLLS